MRQEIDSTERRARVICKLLAQDLALGIDKLRLASAPNFSGPAKRRRHLRSLTTPDEFERAMALAIERDWLKQDKSMQISLTSEGREVGLHTRAGQHRSRWM